MKLSQVVDISIGYTFRGAVSVDPTGQLLVIQAGDLSGELVFSGGDTLTRVSLDTARTNAFVQQGDILLTSRGAVRGGFKATLVNHSFDTPIIASSSLYILRLVSDNLLPEYLTIYFHSKPGQRALQNMATGATVRSVPLSKLQEMDIPVPELSKQQMVIDVYENMKQQKALLQRKIQIREEIVEGVMNTLI